MNLNAPYQLGRNMTTSTETLTNDREGEEGSFSHIVRSTEGNVSGITAAGEWHSQGSATFACWCISSCFLSHGYIMGAAVPDITSKFKSGRKGDFHWICPLF